VFSREELAKKVQEKPKNPWKNPSPGKSATRVEEPAPKKEPVFIAFHFLVNFSLSERFFSLPFYDNHCLISLEAIYFLAKVQPFSSFFFFFFFWCNLFQSFIPFAFSIVVSV